MRPQVGTKSQPGTRDTQAQTTNQTNNEKCSHQTRSRHTTARRSHPCSVEALPKVKVLRRGPGPVPAPPATLFRVGSGTPPDVCALIWEMGGGAPFAPYPMAPCARSPLRARLDVGVPGVRRGGDWWWCRHMETWAPMGAGAWVVRAGVVCHTRCPRSIELYSIEQVRTVGRYKYEIE